MTTRSSGPKVSSSSRLLGRLKLKAWYAAPSSWATVLARVVTTFSVVPVALKYTDQTVLISMM